jgi:class 3 adenylate cyclase/tetratricopeptide (TPR) repeat protein
MSCARCGADNPASARFCSSCGGALAQTCPSCGASASGRFCNECGAALGGAPSVPASAPAPAGDGQVPAAAPSTRVAERRITSVLFGDLVGFTPLSESRDAEEVRELLSRYFESARTVVERYGGVVEKFIGDAVMAVWGVPTAHEDDAERAVRAGLDLVDVVAQLGDSLGVTGLAMRVGIVTGEVAATLGATGEGMVAGDVVNTAARVQSAASPAEVWVDDATRAATSASVMYDAKGSHELKGKTEPVPLFAVRQVVAAVGGARRVDGLEAPFTGRDRELRLVKELFHATLEEGRPRLVAVFGPAGVGKTRLAWEMDKYTDGITDTVYVYRGRCLSYGEGVGFYALAEMVRSRLDILEGDDTSTAAIRLRQGLATYIPDEDERAWLLPRVATLIGVGDEVSAATSYSRDDLFAAWRTFFERVAQMSDGVGAFLRIDDLHWADAGLLDFLDHLLETAQTPIFILTLGRTELTEARPGFGTGRRATALHLEPLPETTMETIVDGLVANLPTTVRATLVHRAEGIPLFAVETVRALIDRDAVIPREGRYVLADDAAERVDLSELALPTSLHTLIASRLDALPAEERQLVLDAAVLGQSFSREGLAAVHHAVGGAVDVDVATDNLVRKEILGVDTDPRSSDRGHFHFVQALVRNVAYDMLSRRDRKVRHLAAAEFLAAEPDADTIPAVIASHYVDAHAAGTADPDAADLADRAIALLERAAARARDLGAPAEAYRHLQTALNFVADDSATARLTELTARAALAMGLADDAGALAERSRRMHEAAGRTVDAARCLALWGDVQIFAGVGQQAIDPLSAAYSALEHTPGAEPVVAQLALQVARAYYLSVGDALASTTWFDRAVVLAEALDDLPLLASTLSSYGGAFILAGRSRMGLGLLRVSLDLSRQIDAPSAQLRPLNNLISFLATRDLETATKYAEEAVTLVRRLGDRELGINVVGSVIHVLWNKGDWDAAISLMDELGTDLTPTSAVTVLVNYLAGIQHARSQPKDLPDVATPVPGTRADVVVEAALQLLEAADARSKGDLATAATRSAEAVANYILSSGIDDDFPIFWVTAIEDALAVADAASAQRLLSTVADAPAGHITPLARAELHRLRALIDAMSGRNETVEADFLAAESALAAFGAPFHLARSQLDHARWLQERGRSDEAARLFDDAERTFAELRATYWIAQVQHDRSISVG